jgi:hypothetical protein
MSSIQENTVNNNQLSKQEQEQEQSLKDYVEQLGEKEKIAYEIAKNHLGTSFSLKKSIGYKEWLKKNVKM